MASSADIYQILNTNAPAKLADMANPVNIQAQQLQYAQQGQALQDAKDQQIARQVYANMQPGDSLMDVANKLRAAGAPKAAADAQGQYIALQGALLDQRKKIADANQADSKTNLNTAQTATAGIQQARDYAGSILASGQPITNDHIAAIAKLEGRTPDEVNTILINLPTDPTTGGLDQVKLKAFLQGEAGGPTAALPKPTVVNGQVTDLNPVTNPSALGTVVPKQAPSLVPSGDARLAAQTKEDIAAKNREAGYVKGGYIPMPGSPGGVAPPNPPTAGSPTVAPPVPSSPTPGTSAPITPPTTKPNPFGALDPNSPLALSMKQAAHSVAIGDESLQTALSRVPVQFRGAIPALAAQENPDYANTYVTRKQTELQFSSAKSGSPGAQIMNFNTAINHLGTMQTLLQGLNNGSIPWSNSIANTIAQQTGQAAPGNAQIGQQLLGGEIAKTIVGSGVGSVDDRQKAAAPFAGNSSPQQQAGALNTYQQFLAGKVLPLEQQYQNGTNGKTDFRTKYLSPAAKALLDKMAPLPSAPSAPGAVLTYNPATGKFN